MQTTKTFSIFLCLFVCSQIAAQPSLSVLFYNVENLFDTVDNPQTNDDEFLPTGGRRWTNSRYYKKLQQTAKVILTADTWDVPALVGLCEVENDSAMTHLLTRTPLRNYDYRYCITNSRDPRGINVALLYQRSRFRLLGQASCPIAFRTQGKTSRDILHVWGETATRDTLDLFVCHFPSRAGGEKESEADRIDAATSLRKLCDSIQTVRQTPRIILMGDFNDSPQNKSLKQVLKTKPYKPGNPVEENAFYNLFEDPATRSMPGSHKYQGKWEQLDHIIISATLLYGENIRLDSTSLHIIDHPFLLTNDRTHKGVRPKRTYYGFKYEGGFSDHLPLFVKFSLR